MMTNAIRMVSRIAYLACVNGFSKNPHKAFQPACHSYRQSAHRRKCTSRSRRRRDPATRCPGQERWIAPRWIRASPARGGLEKTYIGGHAHVVQKQRRRSLTSLREAGRSIDQVVDRIDKLKMVFRSRPPTSAAGRCAPSETGLAEWTSMPRVSMTRSVGSAFGVGTSSSFARHVSPSAIAPSSSLVKISIAVDGEPFRADEITGQFVLMLGDSNSGADATIFPSRSVR